jgi:cell division septation protein DedD
MTTDIERGGIDVGGSHEPSYYEIALTNRQVVVAFVILLTCVVAAFFSGVWIGRESAARAQERLALLGRGRVLDGANADADKGKQEGQALQEFKFFADSRQHPDAGAKAGKNAAGTAGASGTAAVAAAAPPAADRGGQETPAARATTARPAVPAGASAAAGGAAGSPSRRSTLADDLGRRAGSSAATAGGTASPAAPGTAAGKQARRDGATSPIPPSRAAQAAPIGEAAGEGEPLPDTPAPASRAARGARGSASSSKGAATAGSGKAAISWSPASSATAGGSTAEAGAPSSGASGASGGAASAAAGEMVIQVFSTADKEQADKVRDGLVHAGFTAFLSPIAKGGQTMYRVRIGPFPSRTAAEPVAERVRKERKLDTWITPK